MASSDKRITRTQTLIRESFYALMNEKPAETITVVDVCARAGINRSTFYSHYDDMNDLCSALEQSLADEVLAVLTVHLNKSDPQPALLALLRFIKSKGRLFSIWFERPGINEYRTKINIALYEVAAPVWRKNSDLTDEQIKTLLRYILGGVFAVIREWYRSGLSTDEEELADFLENLVKNGALHYIYTFG